MGIDDALATVLPAGNSHVLLGAMNGWGESKITAHQTAMLQTLGEAFKWLFRTLARDGILGELADPVPLKLQGVLRLLLEGHSEKVIAETLSLSNRTVHKYVEYLYRHFDVRSRPELMARWIPACPSSPLKPVRRN